MKLRQILKELKVTGIKLTDIAEKIGVNIHTLYSITSGRKISKEKEEYITNMIYSFYNKELARIEVLKEMQQKREML